MSSTKITVQCTVKSNVSKVWEIWTTPEHIIKWNAASEDWHTTKAENDVKVGGKFTSRMEAKDGSLGFDFSGVYTQVEHEKFLAYKMEDGREVEVQFDGKGNETVVVETFDAEDQNPVDFQKQGWQAIMDNFKKYVEAI